MTSCDVSTPHVTHETKAVYYGRVGNGRVRRQRVQNASRDTVSNQTRLIFNQVHYPLNYYREVMQAVIGSLRIDDSLYLKIDRWKRDMLARWYNLDEGLRGQRQKTQCYIPEPALCLRSSVDRWRTSPTSVTQIKMAERPHLGTISSGTRRSR